MSKNGQALGTLFVAACNARWAVIGDGGFFTVLAAVNAVLTGVLAGYYYCEGQR